MFIQKIGVGLVLGAALILVIFIGDPFNALIISQMLLSIQLPLTIFHADLFNFIKKSNGKICKHKFQNIVIWFIGLIVTALNLALLYTLIF